MPIPCSDNELLQRWIAHEPTWTYEGVVSVPLQVLSTATDVDLLLDGLDTLADVYCNGQHVLTARNFHRYCFIAPQGQ
jgi:hypothetical protein